MASGNFRGNIQKRFPSHKCLNPPLCNWRRDFRKIGLCRPWLLDSAPFRPGRRGLEGGATWRESQPPAKKAGRFRWDSEPSPPRSPHLRVLSRFLRWKAGPQGATGSPRPWRARCGQNRVGAGDPSPEPGALPTPSPGPPGSVGRSQPLSRGPGGGQGLPRRRGLYPWEEGEEIPTPQLSTTDQWSPPTLAQPACSLLPGVWIPGALPFLRVSRTLWYVLAATY